MLTWGALRLSFSAGLFDIQLCSSSWGFVQEGSLFSSQKPGWFKTLLHS